MESGREGTTGPPPPFSPSDCRQRPSPPKVGGTVGFSPSGVFAVECIPGASGALPGLRVGNSTCLVRSKEGGLGTASIGSFQKTPVLPSPTSCCFAKSRGTQEWAGARQRRAHPGRPGPPVESGCQLFCPQSRSSDRPFERGASRGMLSGPPDVPQPPSRPSSSAQP